MQVAWSSLYTSVTKTNYIAKLEYKKLVLNAIAIMLPVNVDLFMQKPPNFSLNTQKLCLKPDTPFETTAFGEGILYLIYKKCFG